MAMTQEKSTGHSSSGTTTRTVSLREYADLQRDYQEYREDNELDKAQLKQRVTEIEDREAGSSDSEGGVDGSETGSDEPDMLPIERLAKLKESDDDIEENPFADTTPSVDRAVAIYQNFRQWSSKAPSGRVVRDNLKNLLNTATGETLAWKQVYRACRKLVEWSKESITFKKTKRHGWILVQERSSSVANG